jgi:hypothetical protein
MCYRSYHLSIFGMTSIAQQKEHLRKAEEADALAESTSDPVARETWKRIAVAYRNLAQMPTAKTEWLAL